MSFPAHIFKAYDIRGLYPREVSEALAFDIGRAYAEFMKQDTGKAAPTLVVSHDMRASSLPLKERLITGIREQGANVVDIGLASTPTFYFGVAYYGYDGGIEVTASHNPAAYNGFKMVRAGAVPISGDTGIQTIRDIVERGEFTKAIVPGTLATRTGVLEEEIAYAWTQANRAALKPMTIVVDAANGMGSPLMSALFAVHLPGSLLPLYFDLDGTFPNHEANPLKDENNLDLQKKVVEVGADLGIALDGDADRIFFVDNTGHTISPAIIRGILAKIYLREYPGAPICYDIRPGKITVDMITAAGGIPVVTKVGHSLIKEKAREVGAAFAGESSGHFFVKSPHGFFEMPEIVTLKFLQELSESGKTAREYVAPLDVYIHSGEINFVVEDKSGVFARLRERYGDHLQYDFDGLSFTWETWWFNVRPSNTENIIRLNLEATTREEMEEKLTEVSRLIDMRTEN